MARKVISQSYSTQNICTLLRKHLGQRTVLGIAIPVLAGHIDAIKREEVFAGLTGRQIESGFRELSAKFLKSDYHSTYIDRRLGQGGFLELSGNKYQIRKILLDGMSLDELKQLHSELIDSLRSAYEQRQ